MIMRPHVELIDEQDLLWHMAELPHGEGEARQQNLCYDEENGAASLRVNFDTDWRRGPGLHAAQTEWFVLEGSVQFGDRTLGKGGYWCAPKGTEPRKSAPRLAQKSSYSGNLPTGASRPVPVMRQMLNCRW